MLAARVTEVSRGTAHPHGDRPRRATITQRQAASRAASQARRAARMPLVKSAGLENSGHDGGGKPEGSGTGGEARLGGLRTGGPATLRGLSTRGPATLGGGDPLLPAALGGLQPDLHAGRQSRLGDGGGSDDRRRDDRRGGR